MISKRLVVLALTMTLIAGFTPACWADDAEVDGGSWGGAGVSNAIFIPAKAASCAFSGILWFATMSLTGGTKYKMAGNFVHDA
jgi:hypothetical protein